MSGAQHGYKADEGHWIQRDELSRKLKNVVVEENVDYKMERNEMVLGRQREKKITCIKERKANWQGHMLRIVSYGLIKVYINVKKILVLTKSKLFIANITYFQNIKLT